MNSWIFYALLSATAAGATAILAKIGVQGVPSNLCRMTATGRFSPYNVRFAA